MSQELDNHHNISFGAQKKGKDSENCSDQAIQSFHLNLCEGEELSFRQRQEIPADEENLFRPREKSPIKAKEGAAKTVKKPAEVVAQVIIVDDEPMNRLAIESML